MNSKVVVVVVVAASVVCNYNEFNTMKARQLLVEYEATLHPLIADLADLKWRRMTGDEVTEDDVTEAAVQAMEVQGKYQGRIQYYLQRPQRVEDHVRRALALAATGYLNRQDAMELKGLLTNMSNYYDAARDCTNSDIEICQTLPGGVIGAFYDEKDPTKLEEIWLSWHRDLGRGLGPYVKRSVSMLNAAAKSVGWNDYSEIMLQTIISFDAPMPVTLLGDLFGRFWSSLYPDIKLYPKAEEPNITWYMQQVPDNYTWMFTWAELRFKEMGLKPLPETFFTNSVLEGDREGDCLPSAWDMYRGKDFRIYMCTEVTEEHLQAIIHLLGHVQYYQHYSHLPLLYRRGANEAFQEALSTMLSLVFTSPTHFHLTGFCGVQIAEKLSEETLMNYLLRVGLAMLPPLPYFLGLEVWREKVYSGVYSEDEWNCEYWRLRKHYSGVLPSVLRTAEDLDMLPNHQLAHTTSGSKHFTAAFLTFQILEALCRQAGHKGPLHTCDLYGSELAGRHIDFAMKEGASKPWPEVLAILTDGQREISAAPLLHYFEPLRDWLYQDGLNAGPEAGKTGWGDTLVPDSGRSSGSVTADVVVVALCLSLSAW